MRRFFLAFFVVVLFLSCKTTPNTQDTLNTQVNQAILAIQDTFIMFIPGNIGGILNGNTLKFYQTDNMIELPDMELTLPNGYESVFEIISDRGAIGVVVDHAVHFFFYDKANGWTEDKDSEFPLPGGYKDVFVISDIGVCVVVDNTVKFYHYSRDGWDELSFLEFTLPSGYKNVFNYSSDEVPRIGVVVGNTVKFYSLEEGDFVWVEQREMELTLPGEYKRVSKYNLQGTHLIMVAVDDKTIFYAFFDDVGWLSDER